MEPFRQCAAVLLEDERGRVLFVYQRRGRYGLPGGVVDHGETPPMAAVREAKEETGLKVALEYVIDTYLLRGGGQPDLFASVYRGQVLGGELGAADAQEILSVDWFDPRNPPTPLLPDAVAALPDFLKGEKGVVQDYWRTGYAPSSE